MYRIGQGWDRHRLQAGNRCVLGGVEFPESDCGPVAHSDGDVVCHAICDALLGALALGDIGHHFPDTDSRFAGADSLMLLARVVEMIVERGYAVVNVDCTVITEVPRISPKSVAMQEALAQTLGVATDRVSVKATRGEGVGPEGRGECLTVQAIALLQTGSPEQSGS